MKFEHALARSAKVWRACSQEEDERNLLVIVTTLELDPEAKKYKLDLVDKLRADARAFLPANPAKAAGFVLMNRSNTIGIKV